MNATTIKEKAIREAKSFALILAYVWAVISLFSFHKAYVLQLNVLSGQTFAIINAFVLAKVIVLLELFKVAHIFQNRPPIFRVILKSVVFGLMLLVFKVIEATVVGCYHGETIAESLEEVHGGRLLEMATLAIIMIVALLPLFVLNEIARSIGKDRLVSILFSTPKVVPVSKVSDQG